MSDNQFEEYPKESRYYHVRINNLTEEQLNYMKTDPRIEWMIIGNIENDENAKGAHRHVAVKFTHAIPESVAINRMILPGTHTTQYYCKPKYLRSTLPQFLKYVIKSGIFETMGKAPTFETEKIKDPESNKIITQSKFLTKQQIKEEKAQLLFEARWKAAQLGDVEWFLENDRKFVMTPQYGKLLANAQPDVKEKLDKIENYYIYGPPGTGKSSSIDYLYPNCYRKIKNNEKWDSYFSKRPGHDVVYFDELDSWESIDMCLGGIDGMKEKTDVYPFPIRQNYGNRQIMIRPKILIITSNFTPSQLFCQPNKFGRHIPNIDMLLTAFNRRFKVMNIQQWLDYNNLIFNHKTHRIQSLDQYYDDVKTEIDKDDLKKIEKECEELDNEYKKLMIHEEVD